MWSHLSRRETRRLLFAHSNWARTRACLSTSGLSGPELDLYSWIFATDTRPVKDAPTTLQSPAPPQSHSNSLRTAVHGLFEWPSKSGIGYVSPDGAAMSFFSHGTHSSWTPISLHVSVVCIISSLQSISSLPTPESARRPQPLGVGDRASSSQQQPQSTFRSALLNLKVPTDLRQGVECLRVFANGQTQKSYLTLSPDKFTLYLTTERKRPRKSASFVQFLFNKPSPTDTAGNAAAASGTQYTERAIDIGAIASIQRGHGTKRFVQAT